MVIGHATCQNSSHHKISAPAAGVYNNNIIIMLVSGPTNLSLISTLRMLMQIKHMHILKSLLSILRVVCMQVHIPYHALYRMSLDQIPSKQGT